MSVKRVIPITPIMRRYQRLRKMPQAERLGEAKGLVAEPEVFASEFVASVEHFASYANCEDHFYPPQRAKHEFADELKHTKDLVLRLKAQDHVVPTDAPGRLTDHDARSAITAVPAEQLAFDYVDRELLVQRTTSPAEWEDGTHNRGGLRLDVLLADAADRTPVVGELRLPGDMDPFFALVQALACAAHLATANQYERIRKHLHRGEFPELSDAPCLDAWVLFVEPPEDEGSRTRKPRYMADLRAAAEALAPKLLADDGISASIRRIAGLRMALDDYGGVRAEVLWAWEGNGA